jgi:hypothetical protein
VNVKLQAFYVLSPDETSFIFLLLSSPEVIHFTQWTGGILSPEAHLVAVVKRKCSAFPDKFWPCSSQSSYPS